MRKNSLRHLLIGIAIGLMVASALESYQIVAGKFLSHAAAAISHGSHITRTLGRF